MRPLQRVLKSKTPTVEETRASKNTGGRFGILTLIAVLLMTTAYASISAGTIATNSISATTGLFTTVTMGGLLTADSIEDSSGVEYVKADGSVFQEKINEVYYVIPNNASDLVSKIEGGNRVVFIPCGQYNISSHINVESNTTILGSGYCTQIYLSDSTNDDALQNNNRTIGNENIIIKNIYIDGNSIGQTSSNGAISFKNSRYIKLEGITIKNTFNHSIILDSSNNTEIIKSEIINSGGANIILVNGGNFINIENNFLDTCGSEFNSISIQDYQNNVNIENNNILNSDHDGITFYGSGIGNIKVINNYIFNASSHGIHSFSDTGSVVISGNIINLTVFDGIRHADNTLTVHEDALISNNYVTNTRYGIYCGGCNSTNIVNNRVFDSNYGILVQDGAYGVSIRDNTASNNVNDGIRLINPFDSDITNNKLFNNGVSGIRLTGTGSYNKISGNSCYNNQYGVLTQNDIEYTMESGNFCRDNSVTDISLADSNLISFKSKKLALNLFNPEELTISSDAVTLLGGSFYSLDTESDAGTDNLSTITGGNQGDIIILRTVTSGRDVTLKDGVGNLNLNGDFILNNSDDTIMLIKVSTLWFELSRSDNS